MDQQGVDVDVVAPREAKSGEFVVSRGDKPLTPPAAHLAWVPPYRRGRDAPRARVSTHAHRCRPDAPVLPTSSEFFHAGEAESADPHHAPPT